MIASFISITFHTVVQRHVCSVAESLITTLLQTRSIWKCWAHSPLRAAARRIAIHQVSPPVHRCPQQQRRRRQRQRVTEGTAMAPQNGPNHCYSIMWRKVQCMGFLWSVECDERKVSREGWCAGRRGSPTSWRWNFRVTSDVYCSRCS